MSFMTSIDEGILAIKAIKKVDFLPLTIILIASTIIFFFVQNILILFIAAFFITRNLKGTLLLPILWPITAFLNMTKQKKGVLFAKIERKLRPHFTNHKHTLTGLAGYVITIPLLLAFILDDASFIIAPWRYLYLFSLIIWIVAAYLEFK